MLFEQLKKRNRVLFGRLLTLGGTAEAHWVLRDRAFVRARGSDLSSVGFRRCGGVLGDLGCQGTVKLAFWPGRRCQKQHLGQGRNRSEPVSVNNIRGYKYM